MRKNYNVQWNLSTRAMLGTQNLAFEERLAAFGGYFLL